MKKCTLIDNSVQHPGVRTIAGSTTDNRLSTHLVILHFQSFATNKDEASFKNNGRCRVCMLSRQSTPPLSLRKQHDRIS